jgi:hypothetical protein
MKMHGPRYKMLMKIFRLKNKEGNSEVFITREFVTGAYPMLLG